jgi:SAM-dependent methyltransferase
MWDQAGAYALGFAGLCAYPIPDLLDALGMEPGKRLADVGCGTGSVSAVAAACGVQVTALDAEPTMVRAAASRVPAVTAVVGALPALPVRSASFDTVVANFVINHLTRPAAAVAELRRAARPGGRVGVTVWPAPRPPLQALWDDVIEQSGVSRQPAALAAADDFPRTRDGLRELMQVAGLREVEAWTVEWDHRVDPEAWWAGAAAGLAGIGTVVARQNPAGVRRMKDAYDRLAAAHLDTSGRLCLRTAAVLAVGSA